MTAFDARATAERLAAESTRWDISDVVAADDGDIPVGDVGPWFETGDADALEDAASVLRTALEEVGFHQLVGHGVPAELTDGILDLTRRFPALPLHVQRTVVIEEIGKTAAYLLSDYSSGVTGEVHYVDSGYNIMSMPRLAELKAEERREAIEERAEAPEALAQGQ